MRRLLQVCLTAALLMGVQDPSRDLRSKDPATRENAVRALIDSEGPKIEKQLIGALKDDDWLVLLAAVEGLEKHGGKAAQKKLIELLLEGPIRVVRVAAARTLATIAPDAAAQVAYAGLRGRSAGLALRALAELTAAGVVLEETAKIEKFLADEDEDEALRSDAARAFVAGVSPAARAAALERILKLGDLLQQAVALEQLGTVAVLADLDCLRPLLADPQLAPVLERRTIALARAALASEPDEDARRARLAGALLPMPDSPQARARMARLLERVAPLLPRSAALDWLKVLAEDSSSAVRAAALKGMRAVGGEAVRDLALAGLASDEAPRARLQCLLTAVAAGALEEEAGEAAVAARAAGDEDRLVCEAACIALGREAARQPAVAALFKASQSDSWELTVSAAVALGKTRSEVALTRLAALAEDDDWRRRAAAAAGLYHLARLEAVQPLLALLEDESPSVAATAERALWRQSGRPQGEVATGGWPEWWQANGQRVRFRSTEEELARRERFGYSVPDNQIYEGLDVVVVPGSGDHMEGVLDRLGISYRTVAPGKLAEGGLHPFAILVAGCTGQLELEDLDVVRWYVRSGGALFTSCWALSYTVEVSFPGLVTMFPSPGAVLDRVSASPVAVGSPFLTGVFASGVVPIYDLQGAHLIQVLDPERVEVLVDSPAAAMRHGSGDLTAWFRAGHGVVLDSVNHFDLQGLILATHLDKGEELKVYAVDHMGMPLEQLRAVAKAKWWSSRSKAAREVDDLSAFRILTNFVREKRMRDG